MSKKISRRDFLKGAAAGALGVSAVGLLGACSPAVLEDATTPSQVPQPSASPQPPAVPAVDDTHFMYGDLLNPQENFSAHTTDYSALFSPLKIGGVTLQNRIVKSCAGSEMQKTTDWPNETSLRYYEQFCKGGVGMVCFETSTVIPKKPPATPAAPSATAGAPKGLAMAALDISTDDGIPAHAAVAEMMHSHNTPLIAQMYDMRMTTGGSSSLAEKTKLETSFNPGLMQTTEQVQQEQLFFIEAAERYFKAGFDGVEINGSCNHYFSTFLSRFSNRERTDQYSGETLENRARIITEIIQGIRARVGNDFIIQVLYSGVEENVADLGKNELCTTVEEACEMAKLFEKAGASSLHIRSQAYGHHCGGFMPDVFHYFEHGDTGYGSVLDFSRHMGGIVIGKYDGVGALLDLAGKIKSCVSIPVGAVGSMDPRLAPDLLNQAIVDGKVDFLLMTRPLMADPAIANKLKEGRRDEVAPCAHCMTCFVAPIAMGTPMFCRVNPAITRAYGEDMPEGYDPVPATQSKKVIVIGGGPAGMEAARTAAQRGHKVTLYEKSSALGGMMSLTQKIKGSHEHIEEHRLFLIRQMELYGVNVVLNKEINVDHIKTEAADAVIVAVGGLPNTLSVTGANSSNVLSPEIFYNYASADDDLVAGDNVVIIGGQFQACELAVHLTKQGKKVTMLNPGAETEFYLNGAAWIRTMGRYWLYGKGVKIYHNAIIKEIANSAITFQTNYGPTLTLPTDHVIPMLPLIPNRALFESLATVCSEVHAAGDCYSPNTIANATARANVIARQVGNSLGAAAGELKENQFSATATGYGDVTVTITVENNLISSVYVDTSNETDGIGRRLGEQFAAQIQANGKIDTVTGATLTSNAVQSALEQCLKQANLK